MATGYKASIYVALSPLVWAFLIASISCGFTIAVHCLFTRQNNSYKWWLIGLLLIILNNMIILILPAIRGYAVYGREDNLSHLGRVINIIFNGYVDDSNIYPVTHLLLDSIILFTGMDPLWTSMLISPIFMCLYVLIIYLLAKATLKNEKMIGLATLSSTMLNISSTPYMIPWLCASLMVPLPIFLFLKKRIEFRILLIMLMVLYPFFHPLSTLLLIMCFTTMKMTESIFNKVRYGKVSICEEKSLKINAVIISSIFFLTWLSNHYYFWDRNINKLITWFRSETNVPTFLQYSENLLIKLNIKGFDFILLFLKLYGGILIYLMLSITGVIMILKRELLDRKNVNYLFILLPSFLIPCIMETLNIFSSLFPAYTLRILRFGLAVSPIFIAFTIYTIAERFTKQYLSRNLLWQLGFVLLLLIPSIISIFNTYTSPYTSTPNYQVTYQEIDGMKWFFTHNNKDIGTYRIRTYEHRFANALFGTLKHPYTSLGPIQYHFGYDGNESIGQQSNQEAYLLVTEYDKVFYTEMYPQLNEFTKSDFQKLNYDPTVAKIYSNGEFEAWKVKS